ncbi:methylated-DNA--protein-cysteine methyltransferase [Actinorhabdospora filicis]|uniref:Methylated-DNA--protein-cysteine methyltransferase n=1 Tax=Actinorhabdospora filicis TaxID=1785913 RepID=A0A9W6SQN0_9ACTN|nr:methylated-DNA--protein-cysteine methyltransferase [Actinorhabdospora filicis]
MGTLTMVADGSSLIGLYMEEQRHRPDQSVFGHYEDEGFEDVKEQLAQYFAGERVSFDLDLGLRGTEFQVRVWHELLTIPSGATRTYGELAADLGNPKASRAVGLANGKNPISIIVPCHRVVGSTGDLTGYGGGLARKRWLLDFERGAGLF